MISVNYPKDNHKMAFGALVRTSNDKLMPLIIILLNYFN